MKLAAAVAPGVESRHRARPLARELFFGVAPPAPPPPPPPAAAGAANNSEAILLDPLTLKKIRRREPQRHLALQQLSDQRTARRRDGGVDRPVVARAHLGLQLEGRGATKRELAVKHLIHDTAKRPQVDGSAEVALGRLSRRAISGRVGGVLA